MGYQKIPNKDVVRLGTGQPLFEKQSGRAFQWYRITYILLNICMSYKGMGPLTFLPGGKKNNT